jgi:hypothetical protein
MLRAVVAVGVDVARAGGDRHVRGCAAVSAAAAATILASAFVIAAVAGSGKQRDDAHEDRPRSAHPPMIHRASAVDSAPTGGV